jgi:hypothetical protein
MTKDVKPAIFIGFLPDAFAQSSIVARWRHAARPAAQRATRERCEYFVFLKLGAVERRSGAGVMTKILRRWSDLVARPADKQATTPIAQN